MTLLCPYPNKVLGVLGNEDLDAYNRLLGTVRRVKGATE